MKKSHLNSKNENDKQEIQESSRSKNSPEDVNCSTPKLKKEFEKDEVGNVKQVDRARHVNKDFENLQPTPQIDFPTNSINQTTETAEHKDFNSNPNPAEFPDKNKKNEENHGNIED